jgi:hypothetical protein
LSRECYRMIKSETDRVFPYGPSALAQMNERALVCATVAAGRAGEVP